MKHAPVSKFNDLVHCPICTHNVPADIQVLEKRMRPVPGQRCPRCHSPLDAAVVLPQLQAA